MRVGELKIFRRSAWQAWPGPGLRHLQAGRRLHPGVVLERIRAEARQSGAAGHERLLPRQPAEGRHVLGRAARARRRDHAGQADHDRRGREEVRPVHQDHRRPAHRSVRRAGASAAADLEGADRRRLRIRPRLWQGRAHGEVLRRLDLVPLRRAGQRRFRHRCRESLQGTARAAQAQVRRLRLHARMRRSAEQGCRHHRDREGLESVRLRQRRHEAAPRRSAGLRSRQRDADPLRRSLPDVLHPHRRSPATHVGVARQSRRRPRLPEAGRHRGQARHRSGTRSRHGAGHRTPTSANGRRRSTIRRRSSASVTSSTARAATTTSSSSRSAARSGPRRRRNAKSVRRRPYEDAVQLAVRLRAG